MFSHVMIGANDLETSKRFYDAILGALGKPPGEISSKGRVHYRENDTMFVLGKPINGEPACHANGGTIGFGTSSQEAVDAWHAAGIANGGTSCEDPPGIRNGTFGPVYLAYLRDPDGNKICALHRPQA